MRRVALPPIMGIRLILLMHNTYISEISSGIFFKISAFRELSIASEVVSADSLLWRYVIISSLLGLLDMLATLSPRCVLISGRMCGLPVTNIQVPGGCWRS